MSRVVALLYAKRPFKNATSVTGLCVDYRNGDHVHNFTHVASQLQDVLAFEANKYRTNDSAAPKLCKNLQVMFAEARSGKMKVLAFLPTNH